MSLPTRDSLLTLDAAALGVPFVAAATGSINTLTLDVAALGMPFVSATAEEEAPPVEGVNSSATIPAIIGNAWTTGWVPVNSSSGTLPSITASGSGTNGLTNTSDGVLPEIIGSGSTHGPHILPSIQASGTGLSGTIGWSLEDLPSIAGSGSGKTGVIGSSSQTLPALTGSGTQAPRSEQTLPSITGSAIALAGQIGRSTGTLPAIAAAGTGSVPIIGRSALTLYPITGTGSGHSSVIGASDVTLKSIIAASSGVSGRVGSSDVTLSVILSDGTGHVQVVGSSTVTLPSIIASGSSAITVGATYQGYALQTQAQALTTYSNVPFNSFARFNNVYLAAGPGGLFVLDGATDAGTIIAAAARVGVTDFGDPMLKRVDAMYVNYRTDGELSLKVITDETDEYDYPLLAHGNEALNTTRARVGRGAKGVYWQFELSNVEGADFDFDRLEPMPLKMTRRIA